MTNNQQVGQLTVIVRVLWHMHGKSWQIK